MTSKTLQELNQKLEIVLLKAEQIILQLRLKEVEEELEKYGE